MRQKVWVQLQVSQVNSQMAEAQEEEQLAESQAPSIDNALLTQKHFQQRLRSA